VPVSNIQLFLYIITEPSSIPSRATAYSHVKQERPHKRPQHRTPPLPHPATPSPRRAAAMGARAEHGSPTRAPRASSNSGQTQAQKAHRHSSRSRAPTRPKPAHCVNRPPHTALCISREFNSRRSAPHLSPNDSSENEFQPGPERGEGGGITRIEIAGAVEWCV